MLRMFGSLLFMALAILSADAVTVEEMRHVLKTRICQGSEQAARAEYKDYCTPVCGQSGTTVHTCAKATPILLDTTRRVKRRLMSSMLWRLNTTSSWSW